MGIYKKPMEINQKSITGPARLTTIWPAPAIKENTEYFEAGPLTFGVEYRYLKTADPEEGVCLHVCAEEGGKLVEYVRFDCFEDDPHYHYMVQAEKRQVVFPMDQVADGDPLHWSVACLKNRLAPMLAYAGAADLARRVEQRSSEVQAAIPTVVAAAQRAIAKVRLAQKAASGGTAEARRAGA